MITYFLVDNLRALIVSTHYSEWAKTGWHKPCKLLLWVTLFQVLMRIDFKAGFNQVASLLRSEAKPVEQADGGATFGAMLGDFLSKPAVSAQRDSIFKHQLDTFPQSQGIKPSPMAKFNFASPGLDKPELNPKVPGKEGVKEAVKGATVSVKNPRPDTPIIIQAQRLPNGNEMLTGSVSPREQVQNIVKGAGLKHGINPVLGLAVASAESSFDPGAVSADGFSSKGLFQLLDSTGQDMLSRLNQPGPYQPFNPEQNAYLGTGYLKYLQQIFSSEAALSKDTRTVAAANSASLEKLAVAAFNAGEGRVASAQARAAQAGKNAGEWEHVAPYLPDSTQQYVQRVMELKSRMEGQDIG
jgi:hypothetical protein